MKLHLGFLLFTFYYLLFTNICFSTEAFPPVLTFSGYSEDGFTIFQNPAGVGNTPRFIFEGRYGSLFPGIIENQTLSKDIAFCMGNNWGFVGFGYRGFTLSDVYSEDLVIANLGLKMFQRRILVGMNFKTYLYSYTFDEYYSQDILAKNPEQDINFDFGIRTAVYRNIFLGLSYKNISKLIFGEQIKYSIPQNFIFGLGYKSEGTIFNLEYNKESIEVQDNLFNNYCYRFGLQQNIVSTKILTLSFNAGLEKGESYTNFLFGLVTGNFYSGIELEYLWSYPVTQIKTFSGNHFVTLKLKFGPQKEITKFLFEKKKPEKELQDIKTEPIRKTISPPDIKFITPGITPVPYPYTKEQKLEFSTPTKTTTETFVSTTPSKPRETYSKPQIEVTTYTFTTIPSPTTSPLLIPQEQLEKQKQEQMIQATTEFSTSTKIVPKEDPQKETIIKPGTEIQQQLQPSPTTEQQIQPQKLPDQQPDLSPKQRHEPSLQPTQYPKIQYKPIEKYKFPLAHKVSSGETLIFIAEKYYNNKDYWIKIYKVNKDKIIKGVPIIGETLIIPEP